MATQNETFYNFLRQYQTDSKEDMTHTVFTEGSRFKINVPYTMMPLFWTRYIEFLNETPSNKDRFCITERGKQVVQYFLDIDANEDLYSQVHPESDPTTATVTNKAQFFASVMDTILIKSQQLVDEYFPTIGTNKFVQIKAFRALYKCHVYYKGLYIDKENAKHLTNKLNELMKTEYSWWKNAFIDTSVYSSGIRMLGCSKNGLGKQKPIGDSEPDPNLLPVNTEYKIADLNLNASSINQFLEYKSLSWSDLANVSIALNTESTAFSTGIDPIKRINTKRNGERISGVAKRVARMNVNSNNDNESTVIYTQEFQDKLYNHLEVEAKSNNFVIPSREDFILVQVSNDCLRIDLPVQVCPFVERMHKRSEERGVSAHYILLTAFDMTFRCWKCDKESKSLALPDESVMNILEENSDDFLLKSSLYKQTHETIASFIASILKYTHAVSLNKSNYNWYWYNKEQHRWCQGEKIVTLIANIKGPIQTEYNRFIRNLSNTTADKDTITTCKELWKKLSISLQTASFIKFGIMPLLARKLEEYWEPIGPQDQENFQSKLDSNISLMGFKNGIFDFKTHTFRAGSPYDFVSMSTNIEYKPWDTFDQHSKDSLNDFMGKIFVNQNHRKYMMQQIALSLDGANKAQSFFILTGGGANGKSTLVKLLNTGLGDYAGEVNVTLFTHARPPANAPTPELIQIKGKRFVTCSEPNGRESFNLGTVKWLTGGDRITAAAKFENNQSFYLQCTFFLLTNDIPQISATQTDYGTWRRMKPVTFNSRFLPEQVYSADPNNEVSPTTFLVDPDIDRKITEWRELFVSLLIEYSIDLFNGLPSKMPNEFTILWKQLQNKNDLYGRFVQDCVIIADSSNETHDNYFKDAGTVFVVFKNWIRSLSLSKNITYDTFEKHMLYLLGDFVVNDSQKGWKIDLKTVAFVA